MRQNVPPPDISPIGEGDTPPWTPPSRRLRRLDFSCESSPVTEPSGSAHAPRMDLLQTALAFLNLCRLCTEFQCLLKVFCGLINALKCTTSKAKFEKCHSGDGTQPSQTLTSPYPGEWLLISSSHTPLSRDFRPLITLSHCHPHWLHVHIPPS